MPTSPSKYNRDESVAESVLLRTAEQTDQRKRLEDAKLSHRSPMRSQHVTPQMTPRGGTHIDKSRSHSPVNVSPRHGTSAGDDKNNTNTNTNNVKEGHANTTNEDQTSGGAVGNSASRSHSSRAYSDTSDAYADEEFDDKVDGVHNGDADASVALPHDVSAVTADDHQQQFVDESSPPPHDPPPINGLRVALKALGNKANPYKDLTMIQLDVSDIQSFAHALMTFTNVRSIDLTLAQIPPSAGKLIVSAFEANPTPITEVYLDGCTLNKTTIERLESICEANRSKEAARKEKREKKAEEERNRLMNEALTKGSEDLLSFFRMSLDRLRQVEHKEWRALKVLMADDKARTLKRINRRRQATRFHQLSTLLMEKEAVLRNGIQNEGLVSGIAELATAKCLLYADLLLEGARVIDRRLWERYGASYRFAATETSAVATRKQVEALEVFAQYSQGRALVVNEQIRERAAIEAESIDNWLRVRQAKMEAVQREDDERRRQRLVQRDAEAALERRGGGYGGFADDDYSSGSRGLRRGIDSNVSAVKANNNKDQLPPEFIIMLAELERQESDARKSITNMEQTIFKAILPIKKHYNRLTSARRRVDELAKLYWDYIREPAKCRASVPSRVPPYICHENITLFTPLEPEATLSISMGSMWPVKMQMARVDLEKRIPIFRLAQQQCIPSLSALFTQAVRDYKTVGITDVSWISMLRGEVRDAPNYVATEEALAVTLQQIQAPKERIFIGEICYRLPEGSPLRELGQLDFVNITEEEAAAKREQVTKELFAANAASNGSFGNTAYPTNQHRNSNTSSPANISLGSTMKGGAVPPSIGKSPNGKLTPTKGGSGVSYYGTSSNTAPQTPAPIINGLTPEQQRVVNRYMALPKRFFTISYNSDRTELTMAIPTGATTEDIEAHMHQIRFVPHWSRLLPHPRAHRMSSTHDLKRGTSTRRATVVGISAVGHGNVHGSSAVDRAEESKRRVSVAADDFPTLPRRGVSVTGSFSRRASSLFVTNERRAPPLISQPTIVSVEIEVKLFMVKQRRLGVSLFGDETTAGAAAATSAASSPRAAKQAPAHDSSLARMSSLINPNGATGLGLVSLMTAAAGGDVMAIDTSNGARLSPRSPLSPREVTKGGAAAVVKPKRKMRLPSCQLSKCEFKFSFVLAPQIFTFVDRPLSLIVEKSRLKSDTDEDRESDSDAGSSGIGFSDDDDASMSSSTSPQMYDMFGGGQQHSELAASLLCTRHDARKGPKALLPPNAIFIFEPPAVSRNNLQIFFTGVPSGKTLSPRGAATPSLNASSVTGGTSPKPSGGLAAAVMAAKSSRLGSPQKTPDTTAASVPHHPVEPSALSNESWLRLPGSVFPQRARTTTNLSSSATGEAPRSPQLSPRNGLPPRPTPSVPTLQQQSPMPPSSSPPVPNKTSPASAFMLPCKSIFRGLVITAKLSQRSPLVFEDTILLRDLQQRKKRSACATSNASETQPPGSVIITSDEIFIYPFPSSNSPVDKPTEAEGVSTSSEDDDSEGSDGGGKNATVRSSNSEDVGRLNSSPTRSANGIDALPSSRGRIMPGLVSTPPRTPTPTGGVGASGRVRSLSVANRNGALNKGGLAVSSGASSIAQRGVKGSSSSSKGGSASLNLNVSARSSDASPGKEVVDADKKRKRSHKKKRRDENNTANRYGPVLITKYSILDGQLLLRFSDNDFVCGEAVDIVLGLICYANRSNDPTYGKRFVDIEAKNERLGIDARCRVIVDVYASDDPTTIRNHFPTLITRPLLTPLLLEDKAPASPSAALHTKTLNAFAQRLTLPEPRAVFTGVELVDDDTTFFNGGYLTFSLRHANDSKKGKIAAAEEKARRERERAAKRAMKTSHSHGPHVVVPPSISGEFQNGSSYQASTPSYVDSLSASTISQPHLISPPTTHKERGPIVDVAEEGHGLYLALPLRTLEDIRRDASLRCGLCLVDVSSAVPPPPSKAEKKDEPNDAEGIIGIIRQPASDPFETAEPLPIHSSNQTTPQKRRQSQAEMAALTASQVTSSALRISLTREHPHAPHLTVEGISDEVAKTKRSEDAASPPLPTGRSTHPTSPTAHHNTASSSPTSPQFLTIFEDGFPLGTIEFVYGPSFGISEHAKNASALPASSSVASHAIASNITIRFTDQCTATLDAVQELLRAVRYVDMNATSCDVSKDAESADAVASQASLTAVDEALVATLEFFVGPTAGRLDVEGNEVPSDPADAPLYATVRIEKEKVPLAMIIQGNAASKKELSDTKVDTPSPASFASPLYFIQSAPDPTPLFDIDTVKDTLSIPFAERLHGGYIRIEVCHGLDDGDQLVLLPPPLPIASDSLTVTAVSEKRGTPAAVSLFMSSGGDNGSGHAYLNTTARGEGVGGGAAADERDGGKMKCSMRVIPATPFDAIAASLSTKGVLNAITASHAAFVNNNSAPRASVSAAGKRGVSNGGRRSTVFGGGVREASRSPSHRLSSVVDGSVPPALSGEASAFSPPRTMRSQSISLRSQSPPASQNGRETPMTPITSQGKDCAEEEDGEGDATDTVAIVPTVIPSGIYSTPCYKRPVTVMELSNYVVPTAATALAALQKYVNAGGGATQQRKYLSFDASQDGSIVNSQPSANSITDDPFEMAMLQQQAAMQDANGVGGAANHPSMIARAIAAANAFNPLKEQQPPSTATAEATETEALNHLNVSCEGGAVSLSSSAVAPLPPSSSLCFPPGHLDDLHGIIDPSYFFNKYLHFMDVFRKREQQQEKLYGSAGNSEGGVAAGGAAHATDASAGAAAPQPNRGVSSGASGGARGAIAMARQFRERGNTISRVRSGSPSDGGSKNNVTASAATAGASPSSSVQQGEGGAATRTDIDANGVLLVPPSSLLLGSNGGKKDGGNEDSIVSMGPSLFHNILLACSSSRPSRKEQYPHEMALLEEAAEKDSDNDDDDEANADADGDDAFTAGEKVLRVPATDSDKVDSNSGAMGGDASKGFEMVQKKNTGVPQVTEDIQLQWTMRSRKIHIHRSGGEDNDDDDGDSSQIATDCCSDNEDNKENADEARRRDLLNLPNTTRANSIPSNGMEPFNASHTRNASKAGEAAGGEADLPAEQTLHSSSFSRVAGGNFPISFNASAVAAGEATSAKRRQHHRPTPTVTLPFAHGAVVPIPIASHTDMVLKASKGLATDHKNMLGHYGLMVERAPSLSARVDGSSSDRPASAAPLPLTEPCDDYCECIASTHAVWHVPEAPVNAAVIAPSNAPPHQCLLPPQPAFVATVFTLTGAIPFDMNHYVTYRSDALLSQLSSDVMPIFVANELQQRQAVAAMLSLQKRRASMGAALTADAPSPFSHSNKKGGVFANAVVAANAAHGGNGNRALSPAVGNVSPSSPAAVNGQPTLPNFSLVNTHPATATSFDQLAANDTTTEAPQSVHPLASPNLIASSSYTAYDPNFPIVAIDGRVRQDEPLWLERCNQIAHRQTQNNRNVAGIVIAFRKDEGDNSVVPTEEMVQALLSRVAFFSTAENPSLAQKLIKITFCGGRAGSLGEGEEATDASGKRRPRHDLGGQTVLYRSLHVLPKPQFAEVTTAVPTLTFRQECTEMMVEVPWTKERDQAAARQRQQLTSATVKKSGARKGSVAVASEALFVEEQQRGGASSLLAPTSTLLANAHYTSSVASYGSDNSAIQPTLKMGSSSAITSLSSFPIPDKLPEAVLGRVPFPPMGAVTRLFAEDALYINDHTGIVAGGVGGDTGATTAKSWNGGRLALVGRTTADLYNIVVNPPMTASKTAEAILKEQKEKDALGASADQNPNNASGSKSGRTTSPPAVFRTKGGQSPATPLFSPANAAITPPAPLPPTFPHSVLSTNSVLHDRPFTVRDQVVMLSIEQQKIAERRSAQLLVNRVMAAQQAIAGRIAQERADAIAARLPRGKGRMARTGRGGGGATTGTPNSQSAAPMTSVSVLPPLNHDQSSPPRGAGGVKSMASSVNMGKSLLSTSLPSGGGGRQGSNPTGPASTPAGDNASAAAADILSSLAIGGGITMASVLAMQQPRHISSLNPLGSESAMVGEDGSLMLNSRQWDGLLQDPNSKLVYAQMLHKSLLALQSHPIYQHLDVFAREVTILLTAKAAARVDEHIGANTAANSNPSAAPAVPPSSQLAPPPSQQKGGGTTLAIPTARERAASREKDLAASVRRRSSITRSLIMGATAAAAQQQQQKYESQESLLEAMKKRWWLRNSSELPPSVEEQQTSHSARYPNGADVLRPVGASQTSASALTPSQQLSRMLLLSAFTSHPNNLASDYVANPTAAGDSYVKKSGIFDEWLVSTNTLPVPLLMATHLLKVMHGVNMRYQHGLLTRGGFGVGGGIVFAGQQSGSVSHQQTSGGSAVSSASPARGAAREMQIKVPAAAAASPDSGLPPPSALMEMYGVRDDTVVMTALAAIQQQQSQRKKRVYDPTALAISFSSSKMKCPQAGDGSLSEQQTTATPDNTMTIQSLCEQIAMEHSSAYNGIYFVCEPPLNANPVSPLMPFNAANMNAPPTAATASSPANGVSAPSAKNTATAMSFSSAGNTSFPFENNPNALQNIHALNICPREHVIYGDSNNTTATASLGKGAGFNDALGASMNVGAAGDFASFKKKSTVVVMGDDNNTKSFKIRPSSSGDHVALQLNATFNGFSATPVLDPTAANPSADAISLTIDATVVNDNDVVLPPPHSHLTRVAVDSLSPYTTQHVVSAVDADGNVLCDQFAVITLVRMPWNAMPSLVAAAHTNTAERNASLVGSDPMQQLVAGDKQNNHQHFLMGSAPTPLPATNASQQLLGVTSPVIRRSISPAAGERGEKGAPASSSSSSFQGVHASMPLGVLSLTIDLMPAAGNFTSPAEADANNDNTPRPSAAGGSGITTITTGLLRRFIGTLGFTTTDPLNRLQLHAAAAEEATAQANNLAQTLLNRQRAAGGASATSARVAAAVTQMEAAYKEARYNADTLMHPSRLCMLKPFDLYVMDAQQVAFEACGRVIPPHHSGANGAGKAAANPFYVATSASFDDGGALPLVVSPPPLPSVSCTVRAEPPLIAKFPGRSTTMPPIISLKDVTEAPFAMLFQTSSAQSALGSSPLISWLPSTERVTWKHLDIFPVSGWCQQRDSLQVKFAGTSFTISGDGGRLLLGKEVICAISVTPNLIRLTFDDEVNAPLSAYLPGELPASSAAANASSTAAITSSSLAQNGRQLQVGAPALPTSSSNTADMLSARSIAKSSAGNSSSVNPLSDDSNKNNKRDSNNAGSSSNAPPIVVSVTDASEIPSPSDDVTLLTAGNASSAASNAPATPAPKAKKGAAGKSAGNAASGNAKLGPTVGRMLAFLSCVAIQTTVKDAKDREQVPTNDRVVCLQIVDRFGLRDSSTSGLNGNLTASGGNSAAAAAVSTLTGASANGGSIASTAVGGFSTPSSASLAPPPPAPFSSLSNMAGGGGNGAVSAANPFGIISNQHYEVFQLLQRVVYLRSGEKLHYV